MGERFMKERVWIYSLTRSSQIAQVLFIDQRILRTNKRVFKNYVPLGYELENGQLQVAVGLRQSLNAIPYTLVSTLK